MLKLKQSVQQAATLSLLVSLVFGSLAPAFSMPVFALEQISNEKPAPQISTGQTDLSQIDLLEKPLEAVPEPIIQPIDIGQINPVEINPEEIIPQEDLLPPEDANRDGEEPEPYIQKDEIKSLTDKLNINTDTNTGAFNYTYPIEIPVGRNNLQPDLALSYNNQDTNNQNLFGYGWSLNIPSIERLNKTGIDNLYTDNYFSSSLGGELAPISLSDNIHGTYGPRVENGDFLKYEYTTSSIWIITDKMGTVYTFGKIQADRQDNPNDNTKIYKWMLSEVRDTNDNFIRYQYYKDAGQIYPEKIFYTGHGEADGVFEIEFIREERADNLGSFQTGFSVTNNYRISQILVKIDAQWQKKYYLNYETGDNGNRSLLSGIQEAAPSPDQEVEAAMPEDEFGYEIQSNVWTLESNYIAPDALNYDTNFHVVDVNGDALADIVNLLDEDYQIRGVYINQGNGLGWVLDNNFVLPDNLIDGVTADAGIRFVDVDGDGLNDILHAYYSGSSTIKDVFINKGDNTGWELDSNYIIPMVFATNTGTAQGVMLGDFNGDGLVDIIDWNTIWDPVDVYINQGDGTGWELATNYDAPQSLMNDMSTHWGFYPVDVNNDNLVDFVNLLDADYNVRGVYINKGDGTGWELDSNYILPTNVIDQSSADQGIRFADVNGDNYIDIIHSIDNNSGIDFNDIFINQGDNTGWVLDEDYDLPINFSVRGRDQNVSIADLNGDGSDDLMRWLGSNFYGVAEVYIAENSKTDSLSNISVAGEKNINIDYQSSAQYTEPDGQVSVSSARDLEVLLPEEEFDYNGDGTGWTEDMNYSIPFVFMSENNEQGVRLADVNGDGLDDAVQAMYYYDGINHNYIRHVFINNGDGTGWTEDTNYVFPFIFTSSGRNTGTNLADVNGDGLVDAVQSKNFNGNVTARHVFINNGDGTGWTEDMNYSIPFVFMSENNEQGVRLADVNGDGYSDALQGHSYFNGIDHISLRRTFINNGDGTGWTEDINYIVPFVFLSGFVGDNGTNLADVNGDGLVDAVQSKNFNGNVTARHVFINNGDGTGWTEDMNYSIPFVFMSENNEQGVRLADVNGDGLDDAVQAMYYYDGINHNYIRHVFINNGDGTGWTEDTNYVFPFIFTSSGRNTGTNLADVNGDGLVDAVQSKNFNGNVTARHVFINNYLHEFLSQISNREKNISLSYQASAQYTEPGEQVRMSSARDVEVLMPEEEFEYEQQSLTNHFNFTELCDSLPACKRLRYLDINGDSLVDVVRVTSNTIGPVYINTGSYWVTGSFANLNIYNSWQSVFEFGDVNGDGLVDVVVGTNLDDDQPVYNDYVYINNGSSWVLDESINVPLHFASFGPKKLIDLNNDSYADIVYNDSEEVYLNNANNTGWALSDWNAREMFDRYARRGDVNGDGLIDYYRYNYQYYDICINTGSGFDCNTEWSLLSFFWETGRDRDAWDFFDFNSDGLDDVLYSFSNSSGTYKAVYLNKGDATWQLIEHNLPFLFKYQQNHNHIYNNVLFFDLNSDSIKDIYSFDYAGDINVYLHENLPKNLSSITKGDNLNIHSSYEPSTQSRDVGDALANPKLPYIIQTVKQINVFDGLATTTIDYQYSGGEQYFDSEHPRDKKFTGFAKVEKTIGDKTTKTYYQQANETNSDGGESTDTYAKIGKVYRQEIYDAEYLKSASIQKWQEENLSTNRDLVYSPEKSQMDFASSTVMTAAQYDYDLTNGNLLAENNLGQVDLDINTGEILDTLVGDEKTTTYEYATNEVKHILSAPKEKVITDTTDTKSQELYYDDLAFGQVNKVNLTKEDYLVDNVEINREFNDLGLVVAETDPENNVSEIVYDENNLYPSETTNALGQTNLTEYNLLNGQIDRSVAPNGAITENQYDAFGRLIKTWVSNNKSPNDLTLKQEISYDDYSFPRSKSVKDYFDVQRSYLIREYYDGLDRVIQTKKQLAEENSWSTQDTAYDVFGRVSRQSLSYVSQSIDYSEPDLNQVAKTYTYDALDRVLTENTPVGTSTYEYNGFTTTIYDANNNRKDLVKDAYGNLVQVKEYNGQDIYTTNYEYSLTNKLTKIIDALGNVRNFVYDDLDNLVWQDMIQRPDVQNIQGITYSYDKNGNVLSQTNLNNQIITYTYDDLNRVLTESVNGGVKIRYTYDEGDYDAGQLTKVEYLDNGNWQEYDYDILGRQTAYRAKIGRQNYTLNQVNLLSGDVSYFEYPNGKFVSYVKNSIGQDLLLGVSGENQLFAENLRYNVNGQLIHLERGNGVVTDYTYDPAQAYRLTNLNTSNATSTLQNIDYTYDAVGNILNITDNASTDLARSATYEYDDLNRLASTTVSYLNIPNSNYSQSFSYDAIGNILSNSALGEYSYELANPQQLSSVGAQNFVYDNAGNLLTDSQKTLTWDWRSRLQKSQNFGTEDFTNYEYDHQNQRLAKITKTQRLDIEPDLEPIPIIAAAVSTPLPPPIDLTNEITLNEEHYVDQYFEKNVQTGDFKAHIFLNGQKIATINNNNAPYYVISDHLNSSSILVDDAGNIAEVSDYRPFGAEAYSNTIIDLDNDYNFTGKETDEESSLQYFGARYMDNNIGRFISIEPVILALHDNDRLKALTGSELQKFLQDPQKLQYYSYSRNNPILFVDLDGNWWKELITGKQAWSSFKVELGQAANQLYNDSGTAKAIMDHPYATGAVVGGAAGAGYAAPYLINFGLVELGLISGGAHQASKVLNSGSRGWSSGSVYNSAKNLLTHFTTHAKEFNARTIQEYYNQANKFIDSKLYNYSWKEGLDTVFYNSETKVINILNNANQIKSFYKVTDPSKLKHITNIVDKLIK
jgi:RHS repeat-associated protein